MKNIFFPIQFGKVIRKLFYYYIIHVAKIYLLLSQQKMLYNTIKLENIGFPNKPETRCWSFPIILNPSCAIPIPNTFYWSQDHSSVIRCLIKYAEDNRYLFQHKMLCYQNVTLKIQQYIISSSKPKISQARINPLINPSKF